MLLRDQAGGDVLAITQPAHAALAGRLAHAWDDELSAALVTATAHHDDVWADWDAAPPLNPATGRPLTFRELGPGDRVGVWSRAETVAAPFGAEAELWMLRHAERLHANDTEPRLRAMTAAFTARIAALVTALRAAEPSRFDDGELARGTSLLALFDVLSLRLCFGVAAPVTAGVLALTPAGDDAVAVAPWPFTAARVETFVEARRLPGHIADQAALDAAWQQAPPRSVAVTLHPL